MHVITAACLFMIYSKFSILSRLQKPYLPSVNMGVCSLWFRGGEEINCQLLYTDADFWKVFEFGFLAGQPYDEVAFKAGLKQAVICESVARRLFGGVETAVGRHLELNFVEFTVCGVVRDVSKFAEQSYSEIWLPYTTNTDISRIDLSGWTKGHTGSFQCFILARSSTGFPEILAEVNTNLAKLNANDQDMQLDLLGQPDTFLFRCFINTPMEVFRQKR